MRWTLVWLALDETTFGHLLETDDGILAYETERGRRVPVFRTREGAALFLRQRGREIATDDGGHYELAMLAAFATHDAPPPDDARDGLSLLSELVEAAGRSDAVDVDAAEAGLEPAAPDEVVRASRRATAQLLAVARSVIEPL